jgi:K+/H+ antiporter YhaU regulatory subunit KhtT
MDTYFIEEGCKIDGMTLLDLDIRRKTGGATIMAVVRDGKGITNPRGDFVLKTGDMLVVLGSHGELHIAMELLKERCPESGAEKSQAEGRPKERRSRDRRGS